MHIINAIAPNEWACNVVDYHALLSLACDPENGCFIKVMYSMYSRLKVSSFQLAIAMDRPG